MFSGIVTELGRIAQIDRGNGHARIVVDCSTCLVGASLGDSISVNGVCLTITQFRERGGFVADLMGETLDRTTLGQLVAGDRVNLEPALAVGARLGGHLVQGHVDGVAEIVDLVAHDEWTTMRVGLPRALTPYVVEKGSITIDGVSLTVTDIDGATFGVGLIPHTLAVTALGARAVGDAVNLEVDVIAKYVEHMLRAGISTPYQAGHDS